MAHAGLGLADPRHAARRHRLPGRGRACWPRSPPPRPCRWCASLARSRHHHEDARCRRLRHHLPDGEQRAPTPRSWSRRCAIRPGAPAASGRSGRCSMPAPTTPRQANDTVMAFAMIETRQALDNLDDILSVDGLDADLCRPGRSVAGARLHAEVRPGREGRGRGDRPASSRKAREHGVVAGIHNGTPEYALQMVEKGFQLRDYRLGCAADGGGRAAVVAKMRSRSGRRRDRSALLEAEHAAMTSARRPSSCARTAGSACTICAPSATARASGRWATAPEDYAGKPVIGIINTWSDINQCHAHFKERVEDVKRGVFQAGGFPLELPAISLSRAVRQADDHALPQLPGHGDRGAAAQPSASTARC